MAEKTCSEQSVIEESTSHPLHAISPEDVEEPRFKQRSSPEKAHEYDFTDIRKIPMNSNTLPLNTKCESIAHMLKFFFGGGIFAMHVAFSQIGVTSAILGLVFLALLVGIFMCMLVDSAQKMYGRLHVAKLSYPDLVEAAMLLSPWCKLKKAAKCGRLLVEFILMFHLMGCCAVYQIFMAQNLKQLVEASDEVIYETDYGMLKLYIFAMIVPCILIAMVRNLKNFAPFSIVIDLYVILVALVTIYFGVKDDKISMDLIPSIKSAASLFRFIGICLFSLESISVSLPIENNMADPVSFRYVVVGSLPYATFMMIIIGAFGYWSFGDSVIAPITVHFPLNHFPIMAKVFLCIVIYITYAEIFYFGFDIQWHYVKMFHNMENWWFWERLYKATDVIIVALVAYEVPNVCNVMGFLGCFSVPLLCFMFPAYIKLLTDWKYPGLGFCYWRLISFIVTCLFGWTIIIAGTYYNSWDLMVI